MSSSNEAQEVLDSLRGVEPAAAADALDWQELARRREAEPRSNPFHFENPKSQEISDRWFRLRIEATIEQKNAVGMAYVTKFYGVDWAVVDAFLRGEHAAYEEVGLSQVIGDRERHDIVGFWEEVSEAIPGLHTEEEIDFIKEGGTGAVLNFMDHVEPIMAEQSPVVRKLRENAHVYK